MVGYHRMQYVEYDANNTDVLLTVLSNRAEAIINSDVIANGLNEYGGVFVGFIIGKVRYVVDVIDPGLSSKSTYTSFSWDTDYVNSQITRLRSIYKIPLIVVGFYHRHPGSMDFHSKCDESTIKQNLSHMSQGLISMLVNVDTKLRKTFYYCIGNTLTEVPYAVGDEYFPEEYLQYATAEDFEQRTAVQIVKTASLYT